MDKIAVIGGLGTLSGGDLFFKLLKNKRVLANQLDYNFVFEQRAYSQINKPLYQEEDIRSRKFYAYTVCKNFEETGVTKILMPCFASHSFLDELQKEIAVPIVNIYQSLSIYLSSKVKKGSRIGILASDFVKENKSIHDYFCDYELVFPLEQLHLMESVYGESGIKNGFLEGLPLEHIYHACLDLHSQGCEIIVPCITELSLIVDQLWKRGVNIIDVNQIYVDYSLESDDGIPRKQFKLGILGGVGPSATVDFMNKVIMNTPAKKDQDHIKMVVEQNPQVPDRTANLILRETDPTIAMFSTCKRLEAEGADAIAIPCNTAHAFVERIQEHLKIPIVNMLTTTADHIFREFGKDIKIGLLATTGTINSEVYLDVLTPYGFQVFVPDQQRQDDVMESIYGNYGVKAGFTNGQSKDSIDRAADFLVDQGSDVIILGCTELPLLFEQESHIKKNGRTIILVDPTLILAKKIVDISKAPID